jgi:hypothetical protein
VRKASKTHKPSIFYRAKLSYESGDYDSAKKDVCLLIEKYFGNKFDLDAIDLNRLINILMPELHSSQTEKNFAKKIMIRLEEVFHKI